MSMRGIWGLKEVKRDKYRIGSNNEIFSLVNGISWGITRPGVHRAPWVFGRKLSAGAALGTEQIFCSRRLDLAPISVFSISVRCLGHNAPVWKRRSEVI